SNNNLIPRPRIGSAPRPVASRTRPEAGASPTPHFLRSHAPTPRCDLVDFGSSLVDFGCSAFTAGVASPSAPAVFSRPSSTAAAPPRLLPPPRVSARSAWPGPHGDLRSLGERFVVSVTVRRLASCLWQVRICADCRLTFSLKQHLHCLSSNGKSAAARLTLSFVAGTMASGFSAPS
ncbi:hypothetical protein U9M48_003898, partial [Paspalum notatum var. saurae]